ncbi:MAG: glycosyltransferase family 2 protein [Sphingobacterium sp.]
MAKKPIISIIIPCYNVSRFIRETINSILLQNRIDRCELVLVDDASTDNSLEILLEYNIIDNVKIVQSSVNGGVAVARNIGIREAKGEFIMFLDADDEISSGAIELLMEKITPELDVLSFGFRIIDKDKSSNCSNSTFDNRLFTSKEFLKSYFRRSLLQHICSQIIRKDLIDNNFIEFISNTYYAEDQEFQMKVLYYAKNILYIKDELFIYNRGKGATMNSGFNIKRFSVLDVFQRMLILFNEDKELFYYYKNYALYNYYSFLRDSTKAEFDFNDNHLREYKILSGLKPSLIFDSKLAWTVICLNSIDRISHKALIQIFKLL